MLVAVGGLMLGACVQGGAPADAASTRSALQDDPLPAAPALPLGLGCGWAVQSDIDTTNIAFPDNAAKYWVALLPMTPGTRVRIDGRYPAVRYFSYNSYDPLLRALDVQTDDQLAPIRPGNNPLQNPAAAPGARYTAYVVFGTPPKNRAPNTLYAGNIALSSLQIPNGFLLPVIYRTYVPDAGYDFDGGVGLPQLTIETTSGTALASLPTCTTPLLPTLGGLLPDLGLNGLLLGVDYPDTLALPFPTAVYPPRTTRFYSLPGSVLAILSNIVPLPQLQQIGAQLPLGEGGFLSNLDNAYVTTPFARAYGNLILIRAKAPTWRGAPGVPLGGEDMRYWSVCENEFVTQRYVACSADYQTPLDRDGYFTVAISDAADRPANATPAQDITWLPWGPFVDGLFIYRHMLPAAGFAPAIQNIPQGTPPQQVMGDYFPQSTYCRRAVFENAGNDPAAIFAACAADQKANPPG
ncbi:MAG TPA: hypothetical protein VN046_08595 [Stenotrophobium sp.]|jgi:hypothetical protein|nr:hypothetical protein [Stenotrophobium sp.]